MKRLFTFCLVILGGLAVILGYSIIYGERSGSISYTPAIKQPALQSSEKGKYQPGFGKIPLYFIPNKGQTNKAVKFYAGTSRYTLWITSEGIAFDSVRPDPVASRFSLERDISRFVFIGANKNPEMVPMEMTGHLVNIYKGKDPSRWQTDIRTSKAVLVKDLYRNIDLKIYGNENQIEYDWVVKPGGDPRQIRFKYENVKSTAIDGEGNLSIITVFGKLTHKRPVSFQVVTGDKIPVQSVFEKKGENVYGFDVKEYSKRYPLVIDPVVSLEYATYLGGSDTEFFPRIAVDENGQVYMVGYTYSIDFPLKEPYQNTLSGYPCVFLTKIDSTGSNLVFSTYFGGNTGEYFNAITLSGSGDVFIAGDTFSSNLPAVNHLTGGKDGFVARFDTNGHFIQGRYLGGSSEDRVQDIKMYNSDQIIISGFTYSSNFPLKNPYQGIIKGDASGYVCKMKKDLSDIVYSTYFGGSGFDLIGRLAVDSSGYFYAYGRTGSTDLPLKNPIQSTYGGNVYDSFVTKFIPDGSDIEYSTYIGGSGTELLSDIAIDSTGAVYILGFTEESAGFPLKNPFQSTVKGDWDFFICKINPDGLSLGFSTFLGGTGRDYIGDIKITSQDMIIIAGSTGSWDFPTLNPLQATKAGGLDTCICMFSTDDCHFLYSSYFGGTGNDYGRDIEEAGIGNFVLAGITDSTDFPVKNPFQASNRGGEDAFVAKFSYPVDIITLLQIRSVPDPGISIQVTPADIDGHSDGLTPFSRNYVSNTGVLLTAPQTFCGKNFYKWCIDGTKNLDRSIQVTMKENHTVTAYYGKPSSIVLNMTTMNFGASTAGETTGSQSFFIGRIGDIPLTWTVSDNVEWLSCSPTGGTDAGEVPVTVNAAGLTPGTYFGVISVIDPKAINSPQKIYVTLKVYFAGQSGSPFGYFDTPTDGAAVCSSIPVTGWALDDIEVASVKIFRQDGANLFYIGDGSFVDGARPDVEAAFPSFPNSSKAGWGYMMLTNSFPNKGNGAFTLCAVAVDKEGNQTTLGTKTITIDNAHAVKPFGYIDTPTQGGTASGFKFVNFGWVLTPRPNMIPVDGSTIRVYIDGVSTGNPVYNNYRVDIAVLFPEYLNSMGAVGYLNIDTTQYPNGVHTIHWIAEDNAGNWDGIGSRFFTIQNTDGGSLRSTAVFSENDKPAMTGGELSKIPLRNKPIRINKGFNGNTKPIAFYPTDRGMIYIKSKELERVVIDMTEGGMKNSTGRFTGYLMVGNRPSSLPIGSTLDKRGVFYWHPGPGFIGTYRFVFIEEDSTGGLTKQNVTIKIMPKF